MSISDKQWSVYIVECKDKKLYTGISNDVDKRVEAHNKGKGCKFTRCRCPVRLVYEETIGGMSDARKREIEIQKFSRDKKLKLISTAH